MKLINKLDETNNNSPYSGKSSANYEMYLRPMPTVDKDGNPIKNTKRYYIFRLIYSQTEERNYPFIVRNEHEFYRKDASGKIIEVKRICCPTSQFAKNQINEKVDSDYCPICNFSKKQKVDAWKNFKTTGQYDAIGQQISNETKAKWSVYMPVLVVFDPSYERNNNHIRVLRLSGDEGKSTFNRIRQLIAEANEKNISVFNGVEGANIAILCEKQRKLRVKKDGTPIIDKRTGEQASYEANCVTDVRLLTNRLHSYPIITEEAIEKLNFDDNYGTAATKDQLSAFLNENFLDTGASDADFGDNFDNDFGEPSAKSASTVAPADDSESDDFGENGIVDSPIPQENDVFTASDLEDEAIDESPSEAISRITKGKVSAKTTEPKVKLANNAVIPPDVDTLRNNSTSFNEDDLPF